MTFITSPPTFASPPGWPAPLRQYQWEGAGFLVGRDSALLADQMGLGKTVEAAVALSLVLRQPGCARALVIAPASLILNWERELQRWAPELVVRRVQGDAEDRRAWYQLPVPVLLASYDQVRLDAHPYLMGVQFDVVLLDEAQRIKNPTSATSTACLGLDRRRSWALTGTPLENSPDDLVAVWRFVRPGVLHIGLSRLEMQARIKECFLRRTKAEVLPELPPIQVQDLCLELQGTQRQAYDRVWRARGELVMDSGSQACLFALITRLKQLCNYDPVSEASVKGDALDTIVESLSEASDKILVFSQYVKTLRWLSRRLVSLPHAILHGGLTAPQRDAIIDEFQQLPGPRALLVSLRAGGVGLNLQAASTVVLFDRWWNPAVEQQAIERAHRFGRDRPLQVVRFLMRDTIEEQIQEILEEKARLFEHYVDRAESAPMHLLSTQELRRVLGLRPALSDSASTASERVRGG